jgi:hypothetical protein
MTLSGRWNNQTDRPGGDGECRNSPRDSDGRWGSNNQNEPRRSLGDNFGNRPRDGNNEGGRWRGGKRSRWGERVDHSRR